MRLLRDPEKVHPFRNRSATGPAVPQLIFFFRDLAEGNGLSLERPLTGSATGGKDSSKGNDNHAGESLINLRMLYSSDIKVSCWWQEQSSWHSGMPRASQRN
ncbi:Protein of unknown function [Gryllus bimaculatus]|nr:Protein of unknown function [Gryllus bimaculatus]